MKMCVRGHVQHRCIKDANGELTALAEKMTNMEPSSDEEQEYDASSIGYEDTNGSSSSFAAYTDQDSNQKSQK